MSANVTYHRGAVTREQRERLLGQQGCVVWMTGLSGSGKSTIAHSLEARLLDQGRPAYVLDGDNLRHGLNADLGFTAADRNENIRRAAEVAALLADAALIVIASFISPYAADRERARERVQHERFVEVFIDVPIDECERRDPKGLYRRARAGEIQEFTGVSAPYEAPANPDLRLKSAEISVESAVDQIWRMLQDRGYFASPGTEARPA
jgi:adenylylsulfate kinase